MGSLIAEEARLAEDIGAFIEATAPALLDERQERAAWGGGAFNALALRLFEYQYQASPAYAEYCQRRAVSPEHIAHWREIPPVASSELQYFSPAAALGKGLRGQPLKQHQLYLYLTALMPNLRAHLLPDLTEHDRLRIITVARDPEPDTEAVLVFSAIALRFADSDSASYTNNHLGVAAALSKAEAIGEQVCLMGHAHALAQFAEHCRSVGLSFRLNPRSRLLFSGGLERERERMYALFERVFGINRLWCVRMYSPAPGGSQFYDTALRLRACGREVSADSDYLCGPPWVRVFIRSQAGGSRLPETKSGYVTVCDLSNFSNLMVVQSADLAHPLPPTSGGRERFALI
ncbi:MAG: hypothetical protein DLM69_10160 [Candidatus Chloroheliales bacterium]|nr:MAG: hypothetical protein DLM69_10160 [Chloroflexota bacterium]